VVSKKTSCSALKRSRRWANSPSSIRSLVQRGAKGPPRLLVVGQLLAEPGHGPIEVVQLQGVASLDLVVVLPRLGGPVTAGCEEAMEHGEEDGPLHVELEAATAQEPLDDLLASGLLPESLEDQGRADASSGDGGDLPPGMSREQQDGLGEPSPRGQQGIELAALPEMIESPQGGDDPLSGASVLPAVLDDLEVGAWSGGLGAEEHGPLVVRAP